MPAPDAPSEADQALCARFAARHGSDALAAVLEQLDDFLGTEAIGALTDALACAPVFGNLLGRSRKQFRTALEGVADGEAVWMIFTFDPSQQKRREGFEVRSVVGPCGPIRISFEDTVGARV